MLGKQVLLTSGEKKLVTRFAHVLFVVLSVHFVLVAMWLVIARRARAPFFGQAEVSGVKLVVWAALLSCCGVSGLLALTLKSVRAAKPALACWLLLWTIHAWHLTVALFPNMWPRTEVDGSLRSWWMTEIVVQLLADAMNANFLVWFVRHAGDNGLAKDQSLRQPLLPVRKEVHDSFSN